MRQRGAAVFILLLLIASVVALQGGPASAVSPGPARTTNLKITVDGLRRSYLLVTPDGPTTGLPLLVFLHGRSALPSIELKRDGFLGLATNGQAVLVYPGGTNGSWDAGNGCCGKAASAHIDDVDFVTAVINEVKATYHTKASRTYVAGYSNGAKLVGLISCKAPQGIAAFAEYGGTPDVCPTRGRAPFFLGLGALDTTEPAAGKPHDASGTHPSINQALQGIAVRDDCHSPVTTVNGTARIETWKSCTHGGLEYVSWSNLDHHLPQPPLAGETNSMAALMWNFLYRYQLR